MSESELFFSSIDAFDEFSRRLTEVFPSKCTDTFGNTCGVITSKANDITLSVDKREIDEEEAIRQAHSLAQELNCIQGIAQANGPALGSCGRFIISLNLTDTRP